MRFRKRPNNNNNIILRRQAYYISAIPAFSGINGFRGPSAWHPELIKTMKKCPLETALKKLATDL